MNNESHLLSLARLAVKEARFEAEKLKVTFAPSE